MLGKGTSFIYAIANRLYIDSQFKVFKIELELF